MTQETKSGFLEIRARFSEHTERWAPFLQPGENEEPALNKCASFQALTSVTTVLSLPPICSTSTDSLPSVNALHNFGSPLKIYFPIHLHQEPGQKMGVCQQPSFLAFNRICMNCKFRRSENETVTIVRRVWKVVLRNLNLRGWAEVEGKNQNGWSLLPRGVYGIITLRVHELWYKLFLVSTPCTLSQLSHISLHSFYSLKSHI